MVKTLVTNVNDQFRDQFIIKLFSYKFINYNCLFIIKIILITDNF